MKRIHYDWIQVIRDYVEIYPGILSDFIDYQKDHRKINVNRAARGFVLKRKLPYKMARYERGNIIGDILL